MGTGLFGGQLRQLLLRYHPCSGDDAILQGALAPPPHGSMKQEQAGQPRGKTELRAAYGIIIGEVNRLAIPGMGDGGAGGKVVIGPALEADADGRVGVPAERSEEHTSELQSLMRNSSAVFR